MRKIRFVVAIFRAGPHWGHQIIITFNTLSFESQQNSWRGWIFTNNYWSYEQIFCWLCFLQVLNTQLFSWNWNMQIMDVDSHFFAMFHYWLVLAECVASWDCIRRSLISMWAGPGLHRQLIIARQELLSGKEWLLFSPASSSTSSFSPGAWPGWTNFANIIKFYRFKDHNEFSLNFDAPCRFF